jgi:hypothetical protein
LHCVFFRKTLLYTVFKAVEVVTYVSRMTFIDAAVGSFPPFEISPPSSQDQDMDRRHLARNDSTTSPDLMGGRPAPWIQRTGRGQGGEQRVERDLLAELSNTPRGRSHPRRSEYDYDYEEARRQEEERAAEVNVQEAITRGQQDWRSRTGATGKALGVLCIHPGCTASVMFTQSFANHFRSKHGNGQYSYDDRQNFERAIDDVTLLSNPTQMPRVLQHRMQNQELGLSHIARRSDAVVTAVEEMRRDVGTVLGTVASLGRVVDSIGRGVDSEVRGLDFDRKLKAVYDLYAGYVSFIEAYAIFIRDS